MEDEGFLWTRIDWKSSHHPFQFMDLQTGVGIVQAHIGISWKAMYEPESFGSLFIP